MILEGTDQNVHFIWHTPEIESARRQRKLGSNAFIRIDPRIANGKTFLIITDFGSSEQFLDNAQYIRNRAQSLTKRGIVPAENGWAGWLGKYESRLVRVFAEIREERQPGAVKKSEYKGPQFGR